MTKLPTATERTQAALAGAKSRATPFADAQKWEMAYKELLRGVGSAQRANRASQAGTVLAGLWAVPGVKPAVLGAAAAAAAVLTRSKAKSGSGSKPKRTSDSKPKSTSKSKSKSKSRSKTTVAPSAPEPADASTSDATVQSRNRFRRRPRPTSPVVTMPNSSVPTQ